VFEQRHPCRSQIGLSDPRAERIVYPPKKNGYSRSNEPHLTLEGKKGEREIVVEVYLTPFEDDEPGTVFDVNFGGGRDKQEDTD
jgi:hypothetical protein